MNKIIKLANEFVRNNEINYEQNFNNEEVLNNRYKENIENCGNKLSELGLNVDTIVIFKAMNVKGIAVVENIIYTGDNILIIIKPINTNTDKWLYIYPKTEHNGITYYTINIGELVSFIKFDYENNQLIVDDWKDDNKSIVVNNNGIDFVEQEIYNDTKQ